MNLLRQEGFFYLDRKGPSVTSAEHRQHDEVLTPEEEKTCSRLFAGIFLQFDRSSWCKSANRATADNTVALTEAPNPFKFTD